MGISGFGRIADRIENIPFVCGRPLSLLHFGHLSPASSNKILIPRELEVVNNRSGMRRMSGVSRSVYDSV